MSKKKPSGPPEDPFASIPPQERFEAFPALSAFPETAIAFLTGRTDTPPAPTNRPLNQPDSTSTEQPIKKPLTKPFNTPLTPSTTQPNTQPASKKDSPSEGLAKDRPVPNTATPSIAPSAGLSASHKEDQPKNQASDLTLNRSLNSSENPILNPSKSHSQDLLQNLSMGCLKVADRLNHNQRRVLDLLLAVKPYIIKFRDIADALDMREASVRTIMRRLSALAFLTFQKARDGNIQGIRVAFNQHVIEQYQQDLALNPCDNLSQNLSAGQTIPTAPRLAQGLSESRPPSQTTSHATTPNASSEIERKESLSIEKPFGWDDAFLELMWPNVFAAGFRLEQIRQILEARGKLGKELDREVVTLSLDRAEWELEEKGMLVNLSTKEKVRNVAAYIFTALARWGALRAHPEYISREEQAAAAATEELKKRREAAENLETARFERFLAELDAEATERIMAGFPGGSRDAWIKNYWRKHVRDA